MFQQGYRTQGLDFFDFSRLGFGARYPWQQCWGSHSYARKGGNGARVSFCRPISCIELRLLLPQADVNTKGKSAVPPWSVHRRPMGSAARSLSPLYCLDPSPILCDCSISLRSLTALVHFLLGPCSRRMTLLFGQRLPHEPQNCTPKIHSLCLLL